jgi:GAF domain-containing protein
MESSGAPVIGPYGALLEIAKTLAAGETLDVTMHRVAESIGRAMFAQSARLGSYDRRRDAYVHEAAWREGGTTAKDKAGIGQAYSLSKEYPELRQMLESGRLQELHIDDPDLNGNDRAFMKEWGLKTTLDGPLVFGREPIGLLAVGESRFVRHYTKIERGLFSQLCDLAAVGIHSARQARQLEEANRELDRVRLGRSPAGTP